jgi:hypothetical protein
VWITTKSGLILQLPSLEEDDRITASLDEESPELDESFFRQPSFIPLAAPMTLEHLRAEAVQGSREDFLAVLAKVPKDAQPDKGD